MAPSATAPAAQSLRVLLTNITLAGRSGTETVLRNLALSLVKAGHRPIVYSPHLGPIADELRAASIPVTASIETLEETPDVIHGQHVIQTAVALARFPQTPAIFVCHDFIAWHDTPPRLPNLRRYVTISDGFRDRLTVEAGVAPADVSIIPNGIDTELFQPGPPLPKTPRRALVFAKNRGHVEMILEACARLGIEATVVGAAAKRLIDNPHELIPQYDVVFASALTAMEAMACHRAVVVCDGRGLAGMATAERYEGWRRENFGLRSFTKALSVQNIVDEMALYDAEAATALGERVREEMALDRWREAYVDLYRTVVAEAATPKVAKALKDPARQARALAAHLETWDPGMDTAWARERTELKKHVELLESGLAPFPKGEVVPASDSMRVGLSGFHKPEPWGVWTGSKRCVVRFRPVRDAVVREVTVECMSLFSPSRQRYEVECALNGQVLGTIVFDAETSGQYSMVRRTFAAPDLPVEDMLWLSLTTDRLISPSDEGLSNDSRELGFALISVRID